MPDAIDLLFGSSDNSQAQSNTIKLRELEGRLAAIELVLGIGSPQVDPRDFTINDDCEVDSEC